MIITTGIRSMTGDIVGPYEHRAHVRTIRGLRRVVAARRIRSEGGYCTARPTCPRETALLVEAERSDLAGTCGGCSWAL